jgi:adenylylsulfate kinase-like enzyme
MIVWITGNTGAGKTFLADTFTGFVKIDGDDVREVWKLGYSKEDRFENNRRVTRLVKLLHKQGFDIVVSVICPFQEIRDWVTKEIDPYWIYIEHESNNTKNLVKCDTPYEIPEHYDMKLKSRSFKHIDIVKIRNIWNEVT